MTSKRFRVFRSTVGAVAMMAAVVASFSTAPDAVAATAVGSCQRYYARAEARRAACQERCGRDEADAYDGCVSRCYAGIPKPPARLACEADASDAAGTGTAALASAQAASDCSITSWGGLVSNANWRWVSAEIKGYPADLTGLLRARALTRGLWEQFVFKKTSDGHVKIQSLANKRYVTVDLGYPTTDSNYGMLRATANSAKTSREKFDVIRGAQGCMLRSVANGKYVSAEVSYPWVLNGELRARASVPGAWEQFSPWRPSVPFVYNPQLPGTSLVLWAIDVLAGLGVPVDLTNISTMEIWANRESGGGNPNSCVGRWNPLNSTESHYGYACQGGVQGNIKGYGTYEQGINTIVWNLTMTRGVGYEAIIAALRASNQAATLAAISASSFGTKF